MADGMTGALIGAGICAHPCDGQGTLACKEPCVPGSLAAWTTVALPLPVPSAFPVPFFSEMEPPRGSQPVLWRTEERLVSPHTCTTLPSMEESKGFLPF